jgi:hypothetical protein
MAEFQKDIELHRTPTPGLKEGIHALEIVEEIYRKNRGLVAIAKAG